MSALPSKLGKYDIVRALGEGAMGTVYEAVDSVIERTVAIKTIRRSDLDAEEAAEHSRRFLIEAKAAGKLNHPHIISLYDHGDEAGMAYIVMELVQGRELQRYFDDKFAFALGDVVRLMGELLDALGYSHRRGVVHRDVKPANIFITDSGGVKLGDFGIARIESSQKTRVGAVVGTPSYMSPEQIRGETADARSDLYAAGVVLYQFLTGERPYTGNMLAMALKVLNEPVPVPSAINPAVSPELDAVVNKALGKNAAERFQSAAEFWQALAGAVGLVVATPPALAAALSSTGLLPAGERSLLGVTGLGATTGIGAATAHPTHRAAPPSTHPSAAPPAAHEAGEGAGASTETLPATTKSPRLLMGMALALLIGLAGAAWWMWGQRGGDVTSPTAPASSVQTPAATAPVSPSAPTPTPAPTPAQLPVDRPAAAPAAVQQAPQPTPAAPASATPAPASAPVLAPAAVAPAPAAISPTAPATARPQAAPDAKAGGAQRPPAREPRTIPPRPTPSAATSPLVNPTVKAPRPQRCSDILQKASLEPLSPDEAAFLRKECQ